MIASFTDPAHFATFRYAPFPTSGIRAIVLHAINGIKSMMPHAKSVDALGLDVHA